MKNKVRYPENLPLKLAIVQSGRTVTELADTIGVSRLVLSNTINGHYKGTNVIRKLKEEIETSI